MSGGRRRHAARSPQVVVLGDVMTDVSVRVAGPAGEGIAAAVASDTPAHVRFSVGGAGGNVARWLARLDVGVGLVGRVGDDDRGRAAVRELRQAGVDTRVAVDGARTTGTVVALVDADGERTMLTDRGANPALEPRDLPGDWFRVAAHLHVSGYALFAQPARDAALHALALAAQVGMTRSVDAASWAPLRAVGVDRFLTWTHGLDLCRANATEARVLTGVDDVTAAARHLGARYGAAVVTDGPRGAIWSDGVRTIQRSAPPAPVVDATGAGDASTAAWLAATLRSATPADALDRAVATATGAVRAAERHDGP